jgi:hypothetical protein
MLRNYCFFLVALAACAACSTAPPVCQTEQARAVGRTLAAQGLPVDYRAGEGCPAEAFRAAVDTGYREGQARRCFAPDVESRGFRTAQTGAEPFPEREYHRCGNVAALREAYASGLARGRRALCSAAKADESGYLDGGAGRAPTPPPEWERACPGSALTDLRQRYLAAYHRALADFCQGGSLGRLAESDGARGLGRLDLAALLGRCPAGDRGRLTGIYEQAYRRGLARYCDEDTLRREAEYQARQSAEAALPAAWIVCEGNYPDLPARFQMLFRQARAAWVAQECTFRGGERRGGDDAGESNDQATDPPSFCDDAHYPGYLAGYLQGWGAAKDTLCDRETVYQRGAEDGRAEIPASFEAPPLCPPPYRGSLAEAYRAGYDVARLRAELGGGGRIGEQSPRFCRALAE